MTIFERKKSARSIPFIDTSINTANAWLMILVPIVVTLGTVYVSGHPQFLIATFGKTNPELYFEEALISVVPFGISFCSLYFFSGDQFRDLFQGKFLKHWKLIIVLTIAAMTYSMIAEQFVSTVRNSGIASRSTLGEYLYSLMLNIFNLGLEELYAIPIFLGVGALLKSYFNFSRSTIIYSALLISIIAFGLMHFETYDWHLGQMLLVIGVTRVFTTGAFIRTKNIFVSFVIHYLVDATVLTVAFLVPLIK